jgi:D-3-phosphoglycerate dehydrogenase
VSSPKSVAVLSRSFSQNPTLRAELTARCPNAVFNETGRSLAGDELVAFLKGHDGAIVALEKMDAAALAAASDLRVIGKYGVGLDNVDLHACVAHGIKVGWTGGVNRHSVAELTIAFAIAALRHMVRSNREILGGAFRQIQGRELRGKAFGLIGCGHVGKEVVHLLKPFGVRILAHDIRDFSDFYNAHGVSSVSLDQLTTEADIISLHVPLTPATRMLFDANRLARLKPGVILINTARGGLVDEAALSEALKSGHVAAAAFDVFSPEPPVNDALTGLVNFISTGHIGGSTAECVLAMGRSAIDGLFNAVEATDHIPDYLR